MTIVVKKHTYNTCLHNEPLTRLPLFDFGTRQSTQWSLLNEKTVYFAFIRVFFDRSIACSRTKIERIETLRHIINCFFDKFIQVFRCHYKRRTSRLRLLVLSSVAAPCEFWIGRSKRDWLDDRVASLTSICSFFFCFSNIFYFVLKM